MISVVTLLFVAGAHYGITRTWNYRWRVLAKSYASETERPARATRRLTTVIAVGAGAFHTMYAAVRLDVCEDGLALRLYPPFAFGGPRLFLPFEEMTVTRTSWYLNSGSFLIRMRRGNGVELILDDTTRSWIESQTDKLPLQA